MVCLLFQNDHIKTDPFCNSNTYITAGFVGTWNSSTNGLIGFIKHVLNRGKQVELIFLRQSNVTTLLLWGLPSVVIVGGPEKDLTPPNAKQITVVSCRKHWTNPIHPNYGTSLASSPELANNPSTPFSLVRDDSLPTEKYFSAPKTFVFHTGEHHGLRWLLPFPDNPHPRPPTQLCRASSSFPAALFTPCLAMVLARPFGRAPLPTKLPRTLPPTLGRTLPRTLARTPPCAGVSLGVESDSVAVAEAFWSWGPARDIYVHIERESERDKYMV